MLEQVIILSCVSNFLLLLAYKWEWIDVLQRHENKIVSKLFNCQFCMSFWMNAGLTLLFSILNIFHFSILVIFAATVITRKLL